MRNLVVTEFITLDGVMEDPGGGEKSKHGGWSLRFRSEEAGKYKRDELFASGALLLGRVTYQGFAAAWPSMTDEEGFADRMNSLPKFVASATLDRVEWTNSTLLKGDIPEEVSKLKNQPGQDILVYGSGELVRMLRQHDLVDEYRLMVHPVVLGSGKRLFGGGADLSVLRLVQAKTFGSGIVLLTYQRASQDRQ